VSVWYRRIANMLGIPLSDLCDDPAWLAAVAPEDSPVAAAHSPRHPISPISQPWPTPQTVAEHVEAVVYPPPKDPIPTHEDALAPLILAALDQARRMDKRFGELSAVSDLLRRENDDLREQLAARTKERDAATSTLAKIKAAL